LIVVQVNSGLALITVQAVLLVIDLMINSWSPERRKSPTAACVVNDVPVPVTTPAVVIATVPDAVLLSFMPHPDMFILLICKVVRLC